MHNNTPTGRIKAVYLHLLSNEENRIKTGPGIYEVILSDGLLYFFRANCTEISELVVNILPEVYKN